MQTASSGIWIRVPVSTSYDDIHYTMIVSVYANAVCDSILKIFIF